MRNISRWSSLFPSAALELFLWNHTIFSMSSSSLRMRSSRRSTVCCTLPPGLFRRRHIPRPGPQPDRGRHDQPPRVLRYGVQHADGRQYRYPDFPEHFVYHEASNKLPAEYMQILLQSQRPVSRPKYFVSLLFFHLPPLYVYRCRI